MKQNRRANRDLYNRIHIRTNRMVILVKTLDRVRMCYKLLRSIAISSPLVRGGAYLTLLLYMVSITRFYATPRGDCFSSTTPEFHRADPHQNHNTRPHQSHNSRPHQNQALLASRGAPDSGGIIPHSRYPPV